MTDLPSVHTPNPLLQARDLSCERGGRVLFQGLSFSLMPGQMLRIMGKNGSGKSSLLRILCGLLTPAAGEVLWRNHPISHDREAFHAELIYLGHAPALKHDLSALENLTAAAFFSGTPIAHPEAKKALELGGLGSLANKMIRTLSQGQKQRIALSRLRLPAAKTLWLLDEPFNALDHDANLGLQDTIVSHLEAGGVVVLSSHQGLAIDDSPRTVKITL